MNHAEAKKLINELAPGCHPYTSRRVLKVIKIRNLTSQEIRFLEDYAQHLSAKEKAGRKVALLKAENQLLKLRDRLEAVGYQAGDEVFEKLQAVIFAARSDVRSIVNHGDISPANKPRPV